MLTTNTNAPMPPSAGFDALGDVLKPAGMGMPTPGPAQSDNNIIGTGSQPSYASTGGGGGHVPTAAGSTSKVLTGDLDSSLASLAENLTINKSASAQVK